MKDKVKLLKQISIYLFNKGKSSMIFKDIADGNNPVVVLNAGKPVVVIISPEDYKKKFGKLITEIEIENGND
ncbi:MAG: type II toxin-antitoxin system Phd/YefM family antitoxin [Denitrovibrio sp.]|nr:MAG: type II toxin-antitoxin system Phd/YefM family antitoxin [Denitrovibrio sp.]